MKRTQGLKLGNRPTLFGYFRYPFRNRRSNYVTVRTYPASIRLR